MDSAHVVQLLNKMINNKTVDTNANSSLPLVIRNWLMKNLIVEVQYTYWEGNRSTDYLANLTYDGLMRGHSLLQPLPELLSIFREDILGVSRLRLCNGHVRLFLLTLLLLSLCIQKKIRSLLNKISFAGPLQFTTYMVDGVPKLSLYPYTWKNVNIYSLLKIWIKIRLRKINVG